MVNTLGFAILDGQYVQVVDGVIYKRDKNHVYNLMVDIVSQEDVCFCVRVRNTDLTFRVDRKTLQTKAQKELRGNVNMIAFPAFDREILRDTANDVYFHFKNCSLHITKEWAETIERTGEKVIWEDQIIEFELNEQPEGAGSFEDYLGKIAGENFNSFKSALGMVLRNYNGSEGMRALWLCDERYEVGKQNGRTGKGIFWKAATKVRKVDDCSGKDFTPDNQFKFQNMSRTTQIFVIDDVKQHFDFRSMYNYCTEGAEFERKHMDKIKLPLKETPQLIITSNYPPEIEQGSSTTGRLFILPLK
ncbi:MAG: hypothetical protein EOO01_43005, partial [Chitinophagaceae bacterium]